MRRLATCAAFTCLAACGTPDGDLPAAAARYRATVAIEAQADTAAAANWRRFEQNVSVWAPDFTLAFETGAAARDAEERLAAVRSGAVQIAGLPAATAAGLVPELAVLSAPYLFDSDEEARHVLQQVLLEPYRRLFAERGLRLLDWEDLESLQLFSRLPVQEPAGLLGRRLLAETAADGALAESLGAEAVRGSLDAAPAALGTGQLDGGFASVRSYARTVDLAAAAPRYLLTGHAYRAGVVVANKAWFDRLTPHDRDVFAQAYGSAGQALADSSGEAARLLAGLDAGATPPLRLTPAERQQWAAAGAGARQLIVERAGGRSAEILERILAGRQAFAAGQAGTSGGNHHAGP